MLSATEFIAKIKKYNPDCNESRIQKAYIYSKNGHGSQRRHSGDPYFSHPLAVAEILTEIHMDDDTIIAALFHDLVEDTEISLEDIEKDFGEDVAKLVDGVTKLGKIESVSVNERFIDNFRKLTLAMSQDIRVLLIKLADRLHNMRTLFYMPSREKKIKKAQESLDIYAPLAARIGLNNIKDELQELSFEIIEPETRLFIVERLSELIEKKKDFIDKIIDDISIKLKKERIKFEISGRQKNPFSIWSKMKNKNVGFHNLYDIIAFRIIVSNISQCYKVLGIINSNYNMIPGTFHDYISTPKENGYRSLHLVVLGPFNKKIEIQIRDVQMHKEAELGLAAHWSYKDSFVKKNKKNNSAKEIQQYQWIRDLLSLFENSQNAKEIVEHTKINMHKDEVFCFTPNGDIFNLPVGSSAVDFAYAVHSEIGNKCAGVKINGQIAPLRQKLENGDQVEIVTANNSKPSLNWLQFVATAKARSSIRAFIRHEKFEEYKQLGHGILAKFFSARDVDFKDSVIEKTLPHFKIKNINELYVKIAEGIISRQEVLKAAYPNIREEGRNNKSDSGNKKIQKDSALAIEGLVSGMAVHYAGCCNPIPGDLIIGVINTGTGITIHNQSCSNLKNMALLSQRIVDVCWRGNNENGDFLYNGKIHLIVLNNSGSLADISSIIAKKNINIVNLKIINRNADYFEIIIEILVKNTSQIDELVSSLRISKKISEVQRISQ